MAVLGGAVVGVVLLGIGTFFLLYSLTPVPTAISEAANWQSSNVYLPNGKLLGTFSNGGQTRQILTANQMPTDMTWAITAAEDRNFYHEGGISVTGLARAAYEDLFGSGNLQGGSTITMQYAKNYYAGVDTGRNITTKLKEIFIAMKLARERSKTWVLTNYLNTVPFGPTVYGVGAAAEYYFGINLTKPGTTLTIAQAAMLAAMPNAPGVYNPDPKAGVDYTALVNRWHYVLSSMVADGNITQAQANAQTFPAVVPPNNGLNGQEGYLWQMVTQELEAPRQYGGYGLTAQQLATGGYKITTTFSIAKVNALAHAVSQVRAQIGTAAGSAMPSYDWTGAVLENAKTGAIVAINGGPGYGVKNCEKANVACFDNRAEYPEEVGSSFKPYVLSTAVNEDMNVFTSKLNGYMPLAIPYAPATATTEHMPSLLSAPTGYGKFMNQDNAVFNYNGVEYKIFYEPGENFGKPLPVNVATALSSDSAFEDLAHRVGINSIIKMAGQFGVGQNPFNADCPQGGTVKQMAACNDLTGVNGMATNFSTNPKVCHVDTCGSPTITYGESPLTAVEQASTFATLADGGVFHSPHVIASVYRGSKLLPSDVITREVLSPAAAADVDWALSFDNNMTGATAAGTVNFRRGGIIGKTGTLGTGLNASEAWFVGATPKQYALSVALYTRLANGTTQVLDTLPSLYGEGGEYGGTWPATIWNNFMTREFGNQSWQPVDQVFKPVNAYPFVSWIQVKAPQPKKPRCKAGQSGSNCTPTCSKHGHGSQCPGPTSTCQFGVPCTSGTSSSPSPSPSPSPTCTTPGRCGATSTSSLPATTAAWLGLPGSSLVLVAEEPTAVSSQFPLLA